MRQYLDKVEYLRMQLRYLSVEAIRVGQPVPAEFYDIQRELEKTVKNLRSWCRYHGEKFPDWLMHA